MADVKATIRVKRGVLEYCIHIGRDTVAKVQKLYEETCKDVADKEDETGASYVTKEIIKEWKD